ncbi:hypothetical protein [Paenibacillus tepidiphilus]|uniref:hypothetical protein n=1 Tax=Paenibacillus tepidiphilus TaxID=2608683 RepID=UPI00123A2C36|nr:hypothetical protein [Paenibacillus tepidiphilus]
MEIGMKIYYEKDTGKVILNTGEKSGNVAPTTREEDFSYFKVLAERVPDTVGLIELEYRQYAQDFLNATSYRVNTETGELEFCYEPFPSSEQGEQAYQKSLSEQFAVLEQRTEATEAAILALLDLGL